MNNPPDWKSFQRDFINDGNYNFKYPPPPFRPSSHIPMPGYIENPKYPFTYFNGLTHGSSEFCSSDSPDKFEENLKIAPADWKYRSKKVNYVVNSNGYRTKEWNEIDWKESIVLFGCSNTFGIGLSEDETVSHHLSKLTGRYVVNLGFPGGSNELIVNNCAAMIKNFGIPYGVVINWSTTDRMRYYTPTDYYELGPWDNSFNIKDSYIDVSKLWEFTFVDPGNELAKNYYWSTHTDAMFQGRTKYCKISYFGLAAHYTRSMNFFKIDNGARDMVHPGEGNSIEIAEFVTNIFKEEVKAVL